MIVSQYFFFSEFIVFCIALVEINMSNIYIIGMHQ